MNVYPLKSITVIEAQEKQFKLVECLTHYFTGSELLTRGDLGVNKLENKPIYTSKVEKVIAEFFNAEDAILVRGSGTGAIRYGLAGMMKAGSKLLIHDAPAYSTTQTSIEMFGLQTVIANFNDLNDIVRVIKENPDIEGALVQYSRQKPDDSYEIGEVIKTIKENINVPILVDDNYVVMKVDKVGYELGADLTCFSCFKLQGPEGIGCIVGKKDIIAKIKKMHYSGGCQVQGYEAMDVIRGLVYAPVLLAIGAREAEKVLELSKGVKGIKDAFIANAQSKVIMFELEDPIAKEVIIEAGKRGALPNPVGSESKYEIAPLFYKASGTFLKINPTYIDTMIRVNPNRASAETVLKILTESIKAVKGE